MANNNREKQTAALNRAQEKRRQEYREKVNNAVDELRKQGQEITPTNIHRIADVSISYLYKWEEVKSHIKTEREADTQEKTRELLEESKQTEKKSKPFGIDALYDASQERIKELKGQVEKLKQENSLLQGHVVEIHELRDEVERLGERVKELNRLTSSNNVLSLPQSTSDPNLINCASNNKTNVNLPDAIVKALSRIGIKPSVRLNKEILRHQQDDVLKAIDAFEQYRESTNIDKPTACLIAMIQKEATPNISQKVLKPNQEEFDRWYENAVQEGFCINIPKNHLSEISGVLHVRVRDVSRPEGYTLMAWPEAKDLMFNLRLKE